MISEGQNQKFGELAFSDIHFHYSTALGVGSAAGGGGIKAAHTCATIDDRDEPANRWT